MMSGNVDYSFAGMKRRMARKIKERKSAEDGDESPAAKRWVWSGCQPPARRIGVQGGDLISHIEGAGDF
jgi:hypothetical protein